MIENIPKKSVRQNNNTKVIGNDNNLGPGNKILSALMVFVRMVGRKVIEQLPLFLLVLAVFSLVLLSRLIPGEKLAADENIYLVVTVVEVSIFVLPAMIFTRFKGMDFIKDTNITLPGFSKLPFVLFMFLMLVFSNVLITLAFYSGMTPAEGGVSSLDISVELKNFDILGIILTFAVIPAVCEEFVFRCVIMSELKKYGYIPAILISALMFALVHFNPRGFVVYFYSGIILGLTAYVTRSVGASMLLHALYNMYGLFFEGELWGAISRNVNIVLVVFIAVIIMLVSLMVCMWEAERMFYDYCRNGTPPPEGYINRDEEENADEKILKRRKNAIKVFVCPAVIAAVAIYFFVVAFV